MNRSVCLVISIFVILSGAGCAPAGQDARPTPTATGAGGSLGGGAGQSNLGSSGAGTGTGQSNIGSGAPGDVSTSGAGGGGGTGANAGAPAAGSTAPAADPIQAVQNGVTAYQGGDYAAAIMDLMASLAADPNGPAAPAAHYVIARSQQQLNDCTMALAGYQMFLQSYPKDEFADDAQFRIGECRYQMGDYATALVELQKVLDNHAGSDAANDAQYTIGLCYYEQAKVALPGAAQDGLLMQARSAFGAAIDDYPERRGGTTSPMAQYQIGLTYHLVGNCVSELAAMQKVISDYSIDPSDPSAAPTCTATAGHLGACDVNNQRQGAIDSANRHIADLNAPLKANHTCL